MSRLSSGLRRAASAPPPQPQPPHHHHHRPSRPRLIDSFPSVLVENRRVAPGSVVLFDLDDTIVVATEITRAQPLVQSHAGYATVVHVPAPRPSDFFVAVRPLALAAFVGLLEEGYRIGFWSAGTPPYVGAIVQRLVDGVRHMQIVQRFRRNPTMKTERAIADIFVPAAVISLDQARMQWMHDPMLEAPAGSSGGGAKGLFGGARGLRVLGPARSDASLGTVIKEPGKIAVAHPGLARAAPHILLVDNLRHDPLWTLQVRHFVPGSEPTGEGFGTGGPDTVIADVASIVSFLGRAQER